MSKMNTASSTVFIDGAVEDCESLVAGTVLGAEVIVLDPTRDGVEQISEVLAERTGISSLHIVSHGSPGSLQLGAARLSNDTIGQYTNKLQDCCAALTPGAGILLYGCSVAAGEIGKAFVKRLSQHWGVPVAASANKTGSAAKGGDWQLEYTTGTIKTGNAFSPEAMAAYSGVFAAEGVEWIQQLGSAGDEEFSDIAVDSAGNVYISGTTTGDLAGSNAGSYDAWLAKYDALGNQLWVRQFGTAGDQRSSYNSIFLDSAGNIYIQARTGLAKYNSSGTELWANQQESDTDPLFCDITADSAGNTYALSYIKGDPYYTHMGPGEIYSGIGSDFLSVPYDFWVTKYDSSGNPVWVKQFRQNNVTSFDITADSAGNVLIEGRFDRQPTDGTPIMGPYDRWAFMYDSSGNAVTAPYEPSADSAGSDYQIGQLFYGDSNATSDSAGNTYRMKFIHGQTHYASAVKYDSNENPQWVQLLAIPDGGEGAKGIADSAGNVYLAGLTNGNWTDSTAGGSDVWVAKLIESNDANTGPALANSIKLTLDEGASVPITSSELASADAGGDLIAFRAGVLPAFGTLMLNNTPLTVNRTFTREDIDAGHLTYIHDGNETISDMFSFNAADGSSGNISTTTFLMSVSPASETPGEIGLSNSWVAENSPAGTFISNLTGTDNNGYNLDQYTLVDDAGGRFTLDENNFLTVADGTLLDYETATSQTIRVRASNNYGFSVEKDFTIRVTDINEAPAANLEFIRDLEKQRKLVADGAGNVYLIGLDNSGLQPGVLKYDISGTEVQSADLGSAGEEISSYDFAADGAGNVLVAGYGQLAKYDTTGTQLWVKSLDKNLSPANVIADSAGNLYVAGKTAVENADSHYEIIKYDSTGTELWVKQLGRASAAVESFDLAVDSSGSVYFTAGDWMAKYDSSANPVWLKQLGSASSEIAVDSAGNICIAGNTSSGIGRWNAGLSDAWVAKYDTNGTELWVNQLGNPGRYDGGKGAKGVTGGEDYFSAIATDSAGNVYITGRTDGYLGDINAGEGKVWVAKYGALGNQMWVKQFGDEGFSVLSDIAVDSAGKIYLTGFDGYYSEWVAKLDSPSGSNTPPALANNTGLSVGKGGSAAITPSELMAQDADGDTLVYTVTAAPANGTLRLSSGEALGAGSTFNQSQIDAGLLSYTHSGSETASDSFSFTVSDFSGGNISTTIFPISVNPLNSAPTLGNPISDLWAPSNEAFSYQLPEGTFTDSDAGDSISYSATLASGAPLPAWLTFDPTTRTFSGNPSNANVGTVSILVRAGDTAGSSVTDTFDLTVSVTVTTPPAGNTGTVPGGAVPPPAAGDTGTVPGGAVPPPAAGDTGTVPGGAVPPPAAGDTGTVPGGAVPPPAAGDTGSPNPNPAENTQIGSDSHPTLSGGEDSDTLSGGEGVDILAGSQGADFLSGGGGNDLLFGNQDDDFLDGGIGDDTLHGGKGTDTVIGSGGNDILCGDRGADSLTGSEGNDLLFGNAGADSLDGSEGSDTLMAGRGNDSLTGGAGDDFLCGNRGRDTLTGGTGTDAFILTEGFDSDIIADFADGLDVLGLAGTLRFEQLSVSAGAGAALISVAATGELLASLTGVSAHLIGVEDFAAH